MSPCCAMSDAATVATPRDAAAFAALTGVSRETQARLEAYVDLLKRWQSRINLVAPRSLPEVWARHVWDSAQLLHHLPPETESLIDLGSGAGFPGLVLAILGVPGVALAEADQRKASFLREAARVTETPIDLFACRIEAIRRPPCDVVTARALAPLARLLPLARRFCRPDSAVLLLKGQDVEGELTEATRDRILTPDRLPSRSSPSGTILRFTGADIGASHQPGQSGTGR